MFLGHVTRISECPQRNSSVGSDREPGQRGVVKRETEPGVGRDLKGSADEISDDVGMADYYLVGILRLIRIGAMEIFSERSLDSVAILVIVRQLLFGGSG